MSYAQPQEKSSRQLIGFMIVVLFHAVVGYALVNGLARKIVEVMRAPLETKIIEEIKAPPEKPPPPPPPRLKTPPPPYIPPPEVQVQMPQTVQTAISAVTSTRPPAPVAPPGQRAPVIAPPAPVRTPAVVDARACDKPEYPSAALRAQETGVVLLNFLININGGVLESKVERSSGSRRLDEAARQALGLCKFKPATVDGKPEQSWARIEYEWKLE